MAKDNSIQQLNLTFLEFYFNEGYQLRGEIHKAHHWLSLAESRCESFEANKFMNFDSQDLSRAAYLCALVRMELFNSTFNIFRIKHWNKIKENLAIAKQGFLDKTEKWYVEGRLYSHLPPGFGRDIKKAFVALEFLKRLRPEISSIRYWLGRAHMLSGNHRRAREVFTEALKASPPDKRTGFIFRDKNYVDIKNELDGANFGWNMGLGFAPSKGVGFFLSGFDDSLFDTDRALTSSIQIATKPRWKFALHGVDKALFKPNELNVDFTYESGRRDCYGLGMNSLKIDNSYFVASEISSSISIRRDFLNTYYLMLGWQIGGFTVSESQSLSFDAINVVDRLSSRHMGVFGELGLDNRDSRYDPWEGTWLRVKGYFPVEGLGSERSFEKWWVDGWQGLYLKKRKVFSILFHMVHVNGGAPFAAYPTLGGEQWLPSIREDRYFERNLLAFSTQFRMPLLGPINGYVFATSATMASNWTELFSSTWKAGGGLGLHFAMSRFRRQQFRLEAGIFASEFTLRANAGIDF